MFCASGVHIHFVNALPAADALMVEAATVWIRMVEGG